MSLLSDLKTFLSSDKEEKRDVQRVNPNFITHPSRITHTLQLLVGSHVQLSIVLDDQSSYTSRILSISETGLVFDQVIGHEEHAKVLAQKNIRINAKLQSVHCNFNCRITQSKTPDGNGYMASLPEKIYYPQKRAFFRIPLADLETHKFDGSILNSDNNVSGYIYDVCFGGIGIAVYSNSYVKKGDVLSPAMMVLQNGQIIQTDFTVRSIKRVPHERFTRVGCEFLNIAPTTKNSINKFIAECQRERVKNHPTLHTKNK